RPGRLGLAGVVPARVVVVGLGLGAGEDQARAVEVGLAAEVEATLDLVVPGDDGDRTAEGEAADGVVERAGVPARLDGNVDAGACRAAELEAGVERGRVDNEVGAGRGRDLAASGDGV